MGDIGESTCNYLFKLFNKNFGKLHNMFIVQPAPGSEMLKDVMNIYSSLGLPGCVGSMDVTHLHWNKCPSSIANLCTGKEGFPSIAFEVVVGHNKLIHHCTRGY